MKSCPTCNRTFEDTFTFCLIDGAILSAPFDPLATPSNSRPRDTGGARTEELPLPSHPGNELLAPTVTSPLSAAPTPWPLESNQSFNSGVPAPNPSRDPTGRSLPAPTPRRPVNRAVQLIVGVVVIVIIGLLYARLVVPRGTAAFPFRVVSSLSGVILAVFIRRGWVGALISVAVGIVVGTVLLGTMGRFLFVIGNLITFAFYAGYGIIGWAVTRLIGWVMSSLSRKNR